MPDADASSARDLAELRDAEAAPGDAADAEPGKTAVPGPLVLHGALDPLDTNDVSDRSETALAPASESLKLTPSDRIDSGADTSSSLSDGPDTLGAKIAALETLIADRAEEWEPDQAGAGGNAGTAPRAVDWATSGDSLSRHPSAEPGHDRLVKARPDEHAQVPDAPKAALARALSNDGGILDEQALRALISDVVRQELQGPLGERITRNLRKLVRRELHRALTSKDFE